MTLVRIKTGIFVSEHCKLVSCAKSDIVYQSHGVTELSFFMVTPSLTESDTHFLSVTP